jgi:hypothetical protein
MKRIQGWYQGKYIPHRNDPASGLFIYGGYYERHWTARLARWAIGFYMREWKWTLTALAGIVGALFFKQF